MNILADKKQIEEYGNRLKRMRIRHGLTLGNLAKLVDTTKQTLSNIENKKYRSINPTILKSLSKIFRCSPDYLCGKTNKPHEIEVDGVIYTYPISIDGHFQAINRLSQLCGKNIALLDLIADYLELVSVEQRNVFESFMKTFIELVKSSHKQSSTEHN